MKPVTYDFDVITDTPAPQRRLPQPTEHPPQSGAEEERRRAALAEEARRVKVQAAE